jgi:uncharacterized protein YjbJ (UPF0337 family)
MDKDEAKGTWDQTKGQVKEGVGKAIDDPKMQQEGQLDQAKGKVEEGYGKTKEAVKDLTR